MRLQSTVWGKLEVRASGNIASILGDDAGLSSPGGGGVVADQWEGANTWGATLLALLCWQQVVLTISGVISDGKVSSIRPCFCGKSPGPHLRHITRLKEALAQQILPGARMQSSAGSHGGLR